MFGNDHENLVLGLIELLLDTLQYSIKCLEFECIYFFRRLTRPWVLADHYQVSLLEQMMVEPNILFYQFSLRSLNSH